MIRVSDEFINCYFNDFIEMIYYQARNDLRATGQESVNLNLYYIIAVLLLFLFLLEIVIRRIKEIQAAKRAEKTGM